MVGPLLGRRADLDRRHAERLLPMRATDLDRQMARLAERSRLAVPHRPLRRSRQARLILVGEPRSQERDLLHPLANLRQIHIEVASL